MEKESEIKRENDKVLIRKILEAIKSVKHGFVQIIIQDSRVVQIDKTEKFRV